MPIELKNLQKIYRVENSTGSLETVGLGATSLKIPNSQWVSFLGPSGSGKTTLLKLISGLEEKSGGELIQPYQKHEMSYVFQDAALLPWKNVMDNITLPLTLRGVQKDQAINSAMPWVQKLKLEKFLKQYPGELSGGLKMRVSIARALITQPKLILLDEPFAALDEPIRIELGLELRELWKSLKPTILFVTHSITEALWLSDRVVVFQNQPGKIVLDQELPFGLDRPLSLRASGDFQHQVETCFQLLRSQP